MFVCLYVWCIRGDHMPSSVSWGSAFLLMLCHSIKLNMQMSASPRPRLEQRLNDIITIAMFIENMWEQSCHANHSCLTLQWRRRGRDEAKEAVLQQRNSCSASWPLISLIRRELLFAYCIGRKVPHASLISDYDTTMLTVVVQQFHSWEEVE